MATENEILNNLIGYVAELKEREDLSEQIFFWKEVIGMNEDQMKEYEVLSDI